MLKDVEEELETSQDDDTAAHDKHVCLCDTNRKETTAAIEQGETNDAQLQAFIGEALAIIQELQVTRKDARDELYADQKSLDEAKAMRLKERKDFNANATFLNEAIDAAGQAIVVIGVHHPELAQVGSVMTKLQKANLMQSLPSSMVLRKDQLQVLKEFLQQPAGSSAFLVIPDFNSYSPQSGQIFGILMQRNADFENSLSDAEQNEKTSRTPLSTSLLVEAQQEKSLVTSADCSSVFDIPAMEASLGDVVTPGKFKEAFRRHMKDHSTPTKELYNFTADLESYTCCGKCDSCQVCPMRYKVVCVPGETGKIFCNEAPFNPNAPAICWQARIPITKQQRAAVVDALGNGKQHHRTPTPRQVSEDLLGTEAQCPPWRAVQNLSVRRGAKKTSEVDPNGLKAWVEPRKVNTNTSDEVSPYPEDSTDSIFTTSDLETTSDLLLVFAVLRFAEHLAELAEQAVARLGTKLEFACTGDFTSRICWQGYATGFWGVPVARKIGSEETWVWERHLIPVSFVTALSENHRAGALSLRDGQALLRGALRKKQVVVPAPLLRQVNVDWAESHRRAAAASIEHSHIVNDLGHAYTNIDQMAKKIKLNRPPTVLKRMLKPASKIWFVLAWYCSPPLCL